MVIYAHLPWLLASRLTAEREGGRRGDRVGNNTIKVGKRGTGREE